MTLIHLRRNHGARAYALLTLFPRDGDSIDGGRRAGGPTEQSRGTRRPGYEAFEAMKTAVEAVIVRVPLKSGT
ncbi:MAG TPA: hypothetical protein VLV46_11270, partial [Gaiellaceae bacterium]|nr:hypothetical protein [Gaiellaceae bacterium]